MVCGVDKLVVVEEDKWKKIVVTKQNPRAI